MEKSLISFQQLYTNKIENRTRFKIKARYYLELLTPEKMK